MAGPMAITDDMVEAGAKALHERAYLGGPYPNATPTIKAAREKRWHDHPEEDRDYWYDTEIHHDGKKAFREMARTVLQAVITE